MLIVMNEEAFKLSPEQVRGIRMDTKLWEYFKDEAIYSSVQSLKERAQVPGSPGLTEQALVAIEAYDDGDEDSYPESLVDDGDIICSVLNSGTIWLEDGLLHLTDFDSLDFEYVWDKDESKWVSVK